MKRGFLVALLLPLFLCVPGIVWAGNGPGSGKVTMNGGPTATIDSVSAVYTCQKSTVVTVFTVTGYTDDTGTGFDVFRVVIWDDGNIVSYQDYQVAVGKQIQISDRQTWNARVLEGFPGIGVYIYDAPNAPPDVPGAAEIAYLDPAWAKDACRIPTMGEWGMVIFSLLIAATAVYFLKRRRTAA